ncbi:MAG: hypothetical protein KatS3mg009_0961 [Acidimicrobiia bacterium]|nr:MAG: hypothetical protein KatS3mg009_0961 [Acidimicrobiia bacterium]
MAPHQRTLFGGGPPALDPAVRFERVHLDAGSWVDVAREWLHGADELLDTLVAQVDWRRGRRRMYERMVDDPRLSRWYRRGRGAPRTPSSPRCATRSARATACGSGASG